MEIVVILVCRRIDACTELVSELWKMAKHFTHSRLLRQSNRLGQLKEILTKH